MKYAIWTIVLFVFLSVGSKAEEFHPYKIKSGKITFEKRRYSMYVKLHFLSDGTASGSRSNPSYIEEEITYYWDNYGDTAYEVAYQVSKFGGKPLPQKVKKYERLWKGDHRYYYDAKKKKRYADPYYRRETCLKAGKLYENLGWLAVMYPQATVVVEESVAGKMVKHYKESEYYDFYAWNGLILREVNYSTKKRNGIYKRFEPKSEKIAVKVETDIKVDPSRFTPQWLK